MTMKLALLGAVAAGAMLIGSAASATTLLFTVTGDENASWYQDSNPTPDQANSGSVEVPIYSTFGGPQTGDVEYWTGLYGGGFGDVLYGPVMFGGSTSAPTFGTGFVVLRNYYTGAAAYVTITDAVASVPEPATWALMMVGVGGLGMMLRRRSARDLTKAAAA